VSGFNLYGYNFWGRFKKWADDSASDLAAHLADILNPHATTAEQTGAEAANANIQAHVTGIGSPHTAAGVGAAATTHAASHTDGSDDIQSATAGQKGVMTAAAMTKLDGFGFAKAQNLVTTSGSGYQTLRSISIPGNTLGIDKILKGSFSIRSTVHASADTIRMTFGATVIGSIDIVVDAATLDDVINFEIFNVGATNAQVARFWGSNYFGVAYGTAAEDSTAAKTLLFEVNVAAGGGAPSYANPGGTGDRTASITVTDSGGYWAGTISKLVNGINPDNDQYMGAVAVAGRYLRFDFGAGKSKLITEVKWYQDTTDAHGTWQWQGSDNGSDWTDIGSSFTLGGATTQTQTSMSGNASGYRYYQPLGVSGNASANPYINEIEFKIADAGVAGVWTSDNLIGNLL
jgi:hypothetical protein